MTARTIGTVLGVLAAFALGMVVMWLLTMPGGGTIARSAGTGSGADQSAAANGQQVEAAQLSEGQRQLLQSFGIDPDSVVITPSMIACAEAELGAARVEEIENGATPSFMEGAKLLACYRAG